VETSVLSKPACEATPPELVIPVPAQNLELDIRKLKRTPRGHDFGVLHCSIDFVCAISATFVAVFGAYWLTSASPGFGAGAWGGWEVFLAFPSLIVLCCWQRRLYRRFADLGNFRDLYAIGKAVGLASLILGSWFYVNQSQTLSPSIFLLVVGMNTAALIGWRWAARLAYGWRVFARESGTNVLIVGAGKRGAELAAYIRSNRHLGYVVKGFLDDSSRRDGEVLGGVRDLPRVARDEYIDEVFITASTTGEVKQKIIANARALCLDVTVLQEFEEDVTRRLPLEYVGDFPIIELHREPIPKAGLLIKRIVDILFVTLSSVVLVPLMLILAILIRLDSKGPVFYTSKRVGRKGRVFDFYKLRSMVSDAEALREELEAFNERDGVLFKMTNDPRVTRVGRILRKYSLDEIPQFINVLKGDMSLVGPRPPLVSEFKKYKIEHKRRLDVLPGITGLWQVSARKDPSFEGYLSLDLQYIEDWNIFLDFDILLRTIPAVLRGTGH
jgi:exopolysaccharide biosynthesis polyprenyl glycosylphosphotransferase